MIITYMYYIQLCFSKQHRSLKMGEKALLLMGTFPVHHAKHIQQHTQSAKVTTMKMLHIMIIFNGVTLYFAKLPS